jgi:hypothetical protein
MLEFYFQSFVSSFEFNVDSFVFKRKVLFKLILILGSKELRQVAN